VRGAPFDSDFLLAVTHAAMWVLHWPLVVLAAAGSILVWLPPVARLLQQASGRVPVLPPAVPHRNGAAGSTGGWIGNWIEAPPSAVATRSERS
jgi:hypothetical protein